jgi:hypothetical protein
MSRTDGFFPPAQGSQDAMLTWQFAEDAWATVRGTTTTTSDLDRLEHILATVEWAPDPGNDATWRAVTDWAK